MRGKFRLIFLIEGLRGRNNKLPFYLVCAVYHLSIRSQFVVCIGDTLVLALLLQIYIFPLFVYFSLLMDSFSVVFLDLIHRDMHLRHFRISKKRTSMRLGLCRETYLFHQLWRSLNLLLYCKDFFTFLKGGSLIFQGHRDTNTKLWIINIIALTTPSTDRFLNLALRHESVAEMCISLHTIQLETKHNNI